MRRLITLLICLWSLMGFSQKPVPVEFIRADKPHKYILWVGPDSTLQFVPIDSLGTISGTDDQLLTLVGLDLSIENGNTIDLSAVQDGTGTDDQNISGSNWNFSNGQLTIGIENGSSQVVDLDGRYLIAEVDGDPLNELQDLSWNPTTNTIEISDGSNAVITGFIEVSDTTSMLLSYIRRSELRDSIIDIRNDIPIIENDSYDASWDDDEDAATKNAIYDKIEAIVAGGGLTQEEVQDFIGPMVSGNTETRITVIYDDAANVFHFVVDAEVDGSITNELQDLGGSFNVSNGELTITISDGSSAVIALDGRYLQSEVDGSFTNEGSLSVSTGGANSSLINSNTSGSPAVEIEGTGIVNVTESGNKITIDAAGDGTGTDDQTLSLVGTDLSIEGGNTVDLSTIQDGTGTDDQNLSFDPKVGTDVTLNIQDGVDVAFREGANITLIRSGSNLLEISAAGDGTGTDSQDLSVTGDSIKISNGTGLQHEDFADEFDDHVKAEEGKAFDIVNKILTAGNGILFQKTSGGAVTSDHIINIISTQADEILYSDPYLILRSGGTPIDSVDVSSLGGGGGGVSVDTLADYDALRAYAGVSKVVYVQDFTVTYGGDDYTTIGGFFVQGGSGENGATIIDGWQRVFDRTTYLINWFEVDGYDHTGTDNSVDGDVDRFNSMIKVASSLGGGTVTCLPLTYEVDVSGLFSSVRIGVSMESNIVLDLNGAALQPPDGLLDGSWKFEVIHGYTVDNVEIRNGTIRGNTAGQSWSTYQQNGISTGIAFHSEPDSLSSNIRLVDLDVDDFFGNSIWFQSGSLTTYEERFENVYVEDVRCRDYGEGPDFIGVQNLNVTNLYLDPGTVNVGDHLEMSKCQDITITDYVNVGGSGSGSGIDFYGNRRAIVNGVHISNVHNVIEIHRDSDGIYPTDITISNVVAQDSLEKFPEAINFAGDQSGTKDIYFHNIRLRNFYRGFAFQTNDGVGGPIVIDGFHIDSCQQGIFMTSSTDLTIKNGIIKDCTSDGIQWNSYLNDEFSATDVFLRIEDVDIYNNGGNGAYFNMYNGDATYTLNAWVDINSYDNTYTDVLFTEATPGDHPFVIRNENPDRTGTGASVQGGAGVSDFYPIVDIQRLQQAYDGQRVRIHGYSGGIDVQSAAYDYSFVLLDGSSSATIDEHEYIDFFFDISTVRWYETNRSNVSELVDVHAVFDPDEVWGSFTDNLPVFWKGTDFAQDADWSYINDKMKLPALQATDTITWGVGGGNVVSRIDGSYLSFYILATGAGINFKDDGGGDVFQIREDGDVRIFGALKDNINSKGTSGQVPVSNGSGWTWQTPSGGGDVSKSGTPVNNQIAVWAGPSTIKGEPDVTYDGNTFEIESSASYMFKAQSSNSTMQMRWANSTDNYDVLITSVGLSFQKDATRFFSLSDNGNVYFGEGSGPAAYKYQFADEVAFSDVVRDSDGDAGTDGQVLTAESGGLTNWETPSGGGGGGDGYATSGSYDVTDNEIDIDMTDATDFQIDVSDFAVPTVMALMSNDSKSVDFSTASYTSLAPDMGDFIYSEGPGNDTIAYSAGKFTVPFDGVYEIAITYNQTVTGNTKDLEINAGINGTSTAAGVGRLRRTNSTTPGSHTYVAWPRLEAGDTVEVIGREFLGSLPGTAVLYSSSGSCDMFVKLLKKL